jgi:hypothetical protein
MKGMEALCKKEEQWNSGSVDRIGAENRSIFQVI